MRVSITQWVHEELRRFIRQGDLCIDATVGNGGDTEYLCGLTDRVIGFEIQEEALLNTRPNSTIQAVRVGLELLKPGGIISVCVYSGGDTGFAEKEEVLQYLRQLDDRRYIVIKQDFYNKQNHPPLPVLILKLGF